MQIVIPGSFLALNITTILGCLVILSLFSLAGRLHLPLHQLPSYLSHLLFLHPRVTTKKAILTGRIINSTTEKPIKDADIFLFDKASADILLHTRSNEKGYFRFPVLPVFTYTMEIANPLYQAARFTVHESHTTQERTFALLQHRTDFSLTEQACSIFESLLSMCFELLLLLSFIMIILLGYTLGFISVFPFALLAGINLSLWLLHVRHQKSFTA